MAEVLPDAFKTGLDSWRFDPSRGAAILREHFRVATLEGYGFRDATPAVGAAAALLEYAREQKQSPLTHLNGLERREPAGYLLLDESSLRGLEILEPLSGEREGVDAPLRPGSNPDGSRGTAPARGAEPSLPRPGAGA